MQKALAPDISTWPDDDPQLIGSRCGDCGATTFPVQQWCPRCSGADMSEVLLPRRGTLVAWTTQGFSPGPPYAGPAGKDFVPFGVGLVQLGSAGPRGRGGDPGRGAADRERPGEDPGRPGV
ncbi:hypothetical protein LAUMK42_04490 [Mycobacterium persicum]|uniref:ChsH2 rubredoxin-like zinc ribbon domain-containing protein n=1 Tax=Mycobacterium persicum TaxID=1487726 RepID=A0AB38UYD5_9MYCO|nr:hypothetical protein LAUMK42_04490 [Mycobacterium persicum]